MADQRSSSHLHTGDGAERRDLDMTSFLVGAAHDMKNSVSVLIACLEHAAHERRTARRSCTLTDQALYEAQRLNSHLIEVMAVYRMSAGTYPFDPQEIALDEFAREVAARVGGQAEARGVKLEIVPCTEERSWFFDKELILNVVAHSLQDAIKYSRGRVQLVILRAGDDLELRVEDNGKGFPAFMLEYDFSAPGAVNFQSGSTGLGLYFSAKAAELHRNAGRVGRARLENGGELGGGRFILTLP